MDSRPKRRLSPRFLVLSLVTCALLTATVLAVSERKLAAWMVPSWARGRVIEPKVYVTVSGDARSVMIERAPTSKAATLAIVDIESGAVLGRERPKGWWDDLRSWARRTSERDAQNRPVQRILWKAAGKEISLPTSTRHQVDVTNTEGIVIESHPELGVLVVVRHDLGAETSSVVARLPSRSWVRSSADGERLLVQDAASRKARTGRERALILDARDGRELCSLDAPDFAQWIGDGHRYVRAERAGRPIVFDLERSTEADLGRRNRSAWVRVEAVAGEKLLVVDGEAVTVHDATNGKLLRTL